MLNVGNTKCEVSLSYTNNTDKKRKSIETTCFLLISMSSELLNYFSLLKLARWL